MSKSKREGGGGIFSSYYYFKVNSLTLILYLWKELGGYGLKGLFQRGGGLFRHVLVCRIIYLRRSDYNGLRCTNNDQELGATGGGGDFTIFHLKNTVINPATRARMTGLNLGFNSIDNNGQKLGSMKINQNYLFFLLFDNVYYSWS